MADREHQISQFSAQIEQNPGDINALLGRGNIYLEMGRYAKAIADYNKILELDRNHAVAEENRTKAQKLKDIDESMGSHIMRDW